MVNDATNASPNPYSVPRRFNIATIIVVTTAYAFLFSALRLSRCPPVTIATIAGFISFVGLGQAVLFRGTEPRRASILVGIACFLAFGVYGSFFSIGMPDFLSLVLIGALDGYLAGVAVSSVFLLSDVVQRQFQRITHRQHEDCR